MNPVKNPVPKSSKTKSTPKASTVGQTLRTRRLARGLSLADVELATRIRGKYLVAIEADDYKTLPQDVYTRGFIQSYADFLELDGRAITKAYTKERGQQALQLRRSGGVAKVRFVLTPRLLTMVGGTIAVVAVVGYLVMQFQALTAPPSLEITNPSHDQVLYGSLISISGNVGGGADVYVNSSPILADSNGNFTDEIALENGVNSINVSAKNVFGKTTTVTRNILAHVPQTDPSSVLPTAPFNGVAVSVQVQSRATTVTVKIDGASKFSGTMLPGTMQIFKGASSVVIATTDGGATNVTVTNSTVAGKSLGALGRNREAVADFEFNTGTQFQ
jgi:cytoskeletal protein RodZ